MNEIIALQIERLNQYHNYDLIQQISIYLGIFAYTIFSLNVLLFFMLSIARRILKYSFKIGCFLGIIGFFIFIPLALEKFTFFYKKVESYFFTFISKEQIFNFTIEYYYFAIPLYAILSIALIWLTVKHFKRQINSIDGVKGVSKNDKKWIKTAEKNSLNLVFDSKPKTIVSNIFRGILIHGGAGSGKSKTFIYPILDQMVNKSFTGIVYDFKAPELIKLYIRLIATRCNVGYY